MLRGGIHTLLAPLSLSYIPRIQFKAKSLLCNYFSFSALQSFSSVGIDREIEWGQGLKAKTSLLTFKIWWHLSLFPFVFYCWMICWILDNCAPAIETTNLWSVPKSLYHPIWLNKNPQAWSLWIAQEEDKTVRNPSLVAFSTSRT
jgi:hypothetical protein